MKEINIIGCVGHMRSGKDEIGSIIQYLTSDHGINGTRPYLEAKSKVDRDGFGYSNYYRYSSPWKIMKFADKLKDMVCLLIGCSRGELESDEFKNQAVSSEWDSYRIFLIKEEDKSETKVPIIFADEDEAWEYSKAWKGLFEIEVRKELLTPRIMLQQLGTDLMRKQLHTNVWVNATFADYEEGWEVGRRRELDEMYEEGEFTIGEGQKLVAVVNKSDYIDYLISVNRELLEKSEDGVDEADTWIISDVRFPNEVVAIHERNGLLINVVRPFASRYPDLSDYADGFDYTPQLAEDHPDMYKKLTHASETSLDTCEEFDYTIENTGSLDDLIERVKEILIKENII